MKLLMPLLILCFGQMSFGDFMSKDCPRADLNVNVDVFERYITPPTVFIRENSILCLSISNHIESAISFSVGFMPLTDSLRPKIGREYSLRFGSPNTYKISFRGRFYFNPVIDIVVLDSKSFNEIQRQELLKASVLRYH